MLVDDEDYIIDVARLMLEGLGYILLIANNGQAALDLFNEHKESIDLVILDMVMPDMDGEAVFKEMRQVQPDVKVLFASGYYVMEETGNLLREGGQRFSPETLQYESTLHKNS